jgi:DNA-binding MarR family transcriptional regulator
LQILGHETARDILLFIIEHKNPTQTDIVNRIGISPASVNWKITRLITLKIICEVKDGKYKRYQLTRTDDYAKHIVAMLKNYYPTIWNSWNDRLAEIFLSFSKQDDKWKRGNT